MALIRKNLLKIVPVLFLLGGMIFFSKFGLIKSAREKTVKTFLLFFSAMRSPRLSSSADGDREALLEEKDLQIRSLTFDLQKKERELSTIKTILGFKEESGVPLKGARVLFHGMEAGREFILIDQGSRQGVAIGALAVDDRHSLIGDVVETEDEYAKVDLASNPGKTFEVEIPRLNIRALVEGIGSRVFALKLIPRDVQIIKGDIVSLSAVQYRSILLGEVLSEPSESGGVFWNAKVISYARPEFTKIIFLIKLSAK